MAEILLPPVSVNNRPPYWNYISKFLVWSWPYRQHLVILHLSTKLRSNLTIPGRVMTSCVFFKMAVMTSQLPLLRFIGISRLRRSNVISPRSRRHQAAAASHILSSRSQSYLRDWVDAASHIHTDSSQSYLQWRRRIWKITMNELLQFKTKFVSLIAKRQNNICCWFHSFTLFTGTILC